MATHFEDDAGLQAIFRGQFGLITRAQATAVISNDALYRRSQSGLWVRVLPGVYRISGMPSSWETELMAVHLWAGPESAISHRSAAIVHGIDLRSSISNRKIIDVSTTRSLRVCHTSESTRIRVHRWREPSSTERKFGSLQVTRPAKTLIDLSGMLNPAELEQALDSAIRLGLVSVKSLLRLIDRSVIERRQGVRLFRRFLEERAGIGKSESNLETKFFRVLRDYRVERPQRQVEITPVDKTYRVDLAYLDEKMVIEIDSYPWHQRPHVFNSDRERDRDLLAAGWIVPRFTDEDLKDPAKVAEEILGLLQARKRNFRPRGELMGD